MRQIGSCYLGEGLPRSLKFLFTVVSTKMFSYGSINIITHDDRSLVYIVRLVLTNMCYNKYLLCYKRLYTLFYILNIINLYFIYYYSILLHLFFLPICLLPVYHSFSKAIHLNICHNQLTFLFFNISEQFSLFFIFTNNYFISYQPIHLILCILLQVRISKLSK